MSDYSELKRLSTEIASCQSISPSDEAAWMRRTTGEKVLLALEEIEEVEVLRKDADRFRFIEQDASSGMSKIYGDDWLEVVDQLIGVGDKP